MHHLRRREIQDILWLRSLHIVLDADVLFRNISQRLRWRQLWQLHDMRWLSSRTICKRLRWRQLGQLHDMRWL